MISLFLDTCNSNIVVGILKNNKLLYSKIVENNNQLSEKLLPIIENGFNSVNINIKNLNKIYVAIGPGSFTGIRIGVTVVKVIAWSLNIEIVPISSLEVIASIHTDKKYICPMIDARRKCVYTGIYNNELNIEIEDKYTNLDDFLDKIKNKYSDILFVSYEDIMDNSVEPKIDIEKVTLHHIDDKAINPHKIKPNYLKLTEAEERFNDKENK